MRKEKLVELNAILEELRVVKMEQQNLELKKGFINNELYKCELNNGKTIYREKLLKGGRVGSAAIVLPFTVDNEVILTIEPRVFTKKTVGIGLPAGYIEEDEEPYVAALRELEEETGYTTNNLISLGGFYQDMGISAAYNECFMAKNCVKVSDQNLDKDEYIKYFKCHFKEALELIDLGYIEGCNAIITLERAKERILERTKK